MNPAGIGQQTLVGKVIGSGQTVSGMRGGPARRKRKASRKTASRKRRASPAKRATRRSKPARLVKGSAAAKAYMAKIRRKRRK
jgi:hypothetical protein